MRVYVCRLLEESRRNLQLPFETSEEDEDDSATGMMAAAAAAAAGMLPQQLPLPPHGTPPLIYGEGGLLPQGGPSSVQGSEAGASSLNPFGPLPEPSAAAAAAAAGSAGNSPLQAAATPAAAAGPEVQQYLGASTLSSLDGSCSLSSQWPAAEPSSSSGGGGRSGCPVYVMLPLDTVWVVEREAQKVRGTGDVLCMYVWVGWAVSNLSS